MKRIMIICAVTLALLSAGCSNPKNHSGAYSGSCRNLTYGKSAQLILTVIANNDGVVSGDINITGELVGSGSIQGLIEGNTITFTSSEINRGTIITWRGAIKGGQIQGEYVVAADVVDKQNGLVDQQGEWTVSRMR